MTYTVISPNCGCYGSSDSFRFVVRGWMIYQDLETALSVCAEFNAHMCTSLNSDNAARVKVNLDYDAHYWDNDGHWIDSYIYGQDLPARGNLPIGVVKCECGCKLERLDNAIGNDRRAVYQVTRKASKCDYHKRGLDYGLCETALHPIYLADK